MKYLFLIFGLFVLFQLGFIWVLLGLGCLVIYGGLEFLMWFNRDEIQKSKKIREREELLERHSKRNRNKRNVEPESEEERVLREKNEREELQRIKKENKIREQERLVREQELEEERKKKEFWFELDGLETERELNKVFEKLGYKTKLTPIGGDEGLDHILDDEIVVQTKNQKRKTSRPDLQKFRGSMKDYKKGIFVSINGFTHTCEKFVETSDRQIKLFDIDDVIGMSEGKKPEWNE
jgi:restriction endonuclease Mrr|tara:strand:- start:255 stop:965 length:711 start_codon:yes stop_codon:yes gene_type:complete